MPTGSTLNSATGLMTLLMLKMGNHLTLRRHQPKKSPINKT